MANLTMVLPYDPIQCPGLSRCRVRKRHRVGHIREDNVLDIPGPLFLTDSTDGGTSTTVGGGIHLRCSWRCNRFVASPTSMAATIIIRGVFSAIKTLGTAWAIHGGTCPTTVGIEMLKTSAGGIAQLADLDWHTAINERILYSQSFETHKISECQWNSTANLCRMELEELDIVESREGIKTTHEIVVVKIQQLKIG